MPKSQRINSGTFVHSVVSQRTMSFVHHAPMDSCALQRHSLQLKWPGSESSVVWRWCTVNWFYHIIHHCSVSVTLQCLLHTLGLSGIPVGTFLLYCTVYSKIIMLWDWWLGDQLAGFYSDVWKKCINWDLIFLTCCTSPWVIGWVWNLVLALRRRVSPRGPSVFLSVAWERRLKRAIFSVKLRVDRSGSSDTASCFSPSTLRAWAGLWDSFSSSWTTESGWDAWMLSSDRELSVNYGWV